MNATDPQRPKNPTETMTVRLTLRALPNQVPAIHRLRSLLKLMLRAFSFRCESVESVDPDQKEQGENGIF